MHEIIIHFIAIKFLTCGNVKNTQCEKIYLTCVNKQVKIIGEIPVSSRTKSNILFKELEHCSIKTSLEVEGRET